MPTSIKNIEQDIELTKTLEGLTSIFESLSSLKINQLKPVIDTSRTYFDGLWRLRQQLLSDRANESPRRYKYDQRLYLIFTSSVSFAGLTDEQVIDSWLADRQGSSAVVVIGRHGAEMLGQAHKKPIMTFSPPDINKPLDVSPLVKLILEYREVRAIYEAFNTVYSQSVHEVDLLPKITNVAKANDPNFKSAIIYEPAINQIIDYLDQVIIQAAVSQIIFEAQLSEYATRFRLTSDINDRSKTNRRQLTLKYNQLKRQRRDEGLREQISRVGLLE